MYEKINPLVKGTSWARYLYCLGRAKGDTLGAKALAEALPPDTPGVRLTFKALVEEMNITTSSALAQYSVGADYLEVERGLSIFGKILPFARRLPLRSRTVRETAAGSCSWVPESGTKPLTVLAMDNLYLESYKIVTLFVLSSELFKFSRPEVEAVLRKSGPASMAAYLDEQFLDPAVALVAGNNPASITNTGTNYPTTGVALAQVSADLQGMCAALGSWQSPRWVMRPSVAAYIASLSATVFPTLRATPDPGNYLLGIPVIPSANCPAHLIVLFDAGDVLIGDSDEVGVSVARDASVTMDDGVSPATIESVSLFQENLIGFRLERHLGYVLAHQTSCISMVTAY